MESETTLHGPRPPTPGSRHCACATWLMMTAPISPHTCSLSMGFALASSLLMDFVADLMSRRPLVPSKVTPRRRSTSLYPSSVTVGQNRWAIMRDMRYAGLNPPWIFW